MSRFFPVRILIIAILGLLSLGSTLSTIAQETERADDIASVTGYAVELSRLEEQERWNDVYDRLAPEAMALVPRIALGTLYESGTLPIPTDDPEITDVTFDDYAWAAGDEEFPDAATVTYTQTVEIDGTSSEQELTRIFVNDGARWRWLYEADTDQVETATEQADKEVDYESDINSRALERVDTFWAGVFAEAGLEYESPKDIVGITREPYRTGCGREDDIDASGIYYCTFDETIYYSPAFKAIITDEIGASAWNHILAHEWGHHIQGLLDIDISADPELDEGLYGIEIELQADCLAGIYEQDAVARGYLDEDDIDESIAVTEVAGDSRNTRWDDLFAHGTADQRIQSYQSGYNDGFWGCNLELVEN